MSITLFSVQCTFELMCTIPVNEHPCRVLSVDLSTGYNADPRDTITNYPYEGGLPPHDQGDQRGVKGTGTRDMIWLKVVSFDRSLLVGLTDDH